MLTYSGYLFLRDAEGGRKIVAEVPKYKIGETIYFVIENIGKFTQDSDGLYRGNSYMRIKDFQGQVIAHHDNVLGEDTEMNSITETGYLKSPYTFYRTDETDKPGIYRFEMIMVDKVIGDVISIGSDFEIYE